MTTISISSNTFSIGMSSSRETQAIEALTVASSTASIASSEERSEPLEPSFRLSRTCSRSNGKTCIYHPPPPGVDYDENDTIFGKILQGESPAVTLSERENALAFEDIHPQARLHGLIIPKQLIKSVFDLTPQDLPLLEEMREMALEILREREPKALLSGDYKLCFHVPPYNSVNHLHLHVLAPKSQMKLYPKWVKYNTHTKLAASLDSVQSRLMRGKAPVPYKRPNGF